MMARFRSYDRGYVLQVRCGSWVQKQSFQANSRNNE